MLFPDYFEPIIVSGGWIDILFYFNQFMESIASPFINYAMFLEHMTDRWEEMCGATTIIASEV